MNKAKETKFVNTVLSKYRVDVKYKKNLDYTGRLIKT